MDVGLNNHLRRISSELFIKHTSDERAKITISVKNIMNRLCAHFDDEIGHPILFGSYTRDTILPRLFDQNSDVDILVPFNTHDYEELRPESYRNKLKRFALENYPESVVTKDHPSIVLEFHHIKFDLVPAIIDSGFFSDSVRIPDKDGDWMGTEPDEFNDELTEVNTKYSSIVKPIIRLIKYWNASHGYPYNSFDLENEIADMNFRNDNIESAFLYAIEELSTSELSNWATQKVESLRTDAEWIEEYLRRGEVFKAKQKLDRILPGFFNI